MVHHLVAIQIFNSNLFGANSNLFYMGLSIDDILKFKTKEMYFIVLFENCPQLILSIWFMIIIDCFLIYINDCDYLHHFITQKN